LDDIDAAAVQSNYARVKAAYEAATNGSVEEAEARIDMEVYTAMGAAIGITLS
jgi:hypothetical protein